MVGGEAGRLLGRLAGETGEILLCLVTYWIAPATILVSLLLQAAHGYWPGKQRS